jgi:predicted DNA-binding protein (MmcQ/YjbR family)
MGARRAAAKTPADRLRAICLALPEAREVEAWGEATFRVRKKMFAMYATASTHHGQGREAVWLKATPMAQDLLVHADPSRYFSPPYVGKSGWVGINLDRRPSWSTVAELVADAWRLAAPKRLVAQFDAS